MTETLFTSLVTAAILVQIESALRDNVDIITIASIFVGGLFIGLAILVRRLLKY